MPAYRLRLSLFRDNIEIRSRFIRFYADDPENSEYSALIKANELIRDMQYDFDPTIDKAKFYKSTMNADKIIDRTQVDTAG